MTAPAVTPVLATDIAPGQTFVILDRPDPDGRGRHSFTAYWRTDYIPGQSYSDDKLLIRGQVFNTVLADFLARNEGATVVTLDALRAARGGKP